MPIQSLIITRSLHTSYSTPGLRRISTAARVAARPAARGLLLLAVLVEGERMGNMATTTVNNMAFCPPQPTYSKEHVNMWITTERGSKLPGLTLTHPYAPIFPHDGAWLQAARSLTLTHPYAPIFPHDGAWHQAARSLTHPYAPISPHDGAWHQAARSHIHPVLPTHARPQVAHVSPDVSLSAFHIHKGTTPILPIPHPVSLFFFLRGPYCTPP